jgi:hypothetical protein
MYYPKDKIGILHPFTLVLGLVAEQRRCSTERIFSLLEYGFGPPFASEGNMKRPQASQLSAPWRLLKTLRYICKQHV